MHKRMCIKVTFMVRRSWSLTLKISDHFHCEEKSSSFHVPQNTENDSHFQLHKGKEMDKNLIQATRVTSESDVVFMSVYCILYEFETICIERAHSCQYGKHGMTYRPLRSVF